MVIVDTLKIFSVGDVILNQQQSVISIVRKYPKLMCSNCMILSAVVIRQNSLIITLINKLQNKQSYDYYFDLGSEIKLKKNSVIDNKHSFE